MKKNTYKFSVDVVFAYSIFSTDTQKNLDFTVTTDICRDNFSDAVAAFKTYVRYITHDMIELSIPDLVEKRVEGILSISYECEQEGYFETDTNAVCVDSERIWQKLFRHLCREHRILSHALTSSFIIWNLLKTGQIMLSR